MLNVHLVVYVRNIQWE